MNGPARVKNLTKMDNKDLQDKKQVPDVKNMKSEIRKIIEPVGAMDASCTPDGVIEKDI